MGQGTAIAEPTVDDDEYTITMRAFELGFAMGRHCRRYTVKRVAEEFALSPSGAYRLLTRASGSRRVMVVEINGEWYVPPEIDAEDWPY